MDKCTLIREVEKKLKEIYKDDYKEEALEKIKNLIDRWEKQDFKKIKDIDQSTAYLITYGDSIYKKGEKTLRTLHRFLKETVKDRITEVHLLPMFPYTSDDGFSVVDYRKVHEDLGDFGDINEFSKDYNMMFDFVVNHISKSSEWFKNYLNGDEKYKDFFVEFDENFDYSNVTRPRTSSLFHEFKGKGGIKKVWTTFSEDQIDLNLRSFNVLAEITDILLMYAYNGATSIRLDAIGFLWKESKTTCMHLEETHNVIKLWRLILDYFKPNTKIITETNVPHKENISYFGNGDDEANMVYQFSLPPLVLYSLTTHNGLKLTNWAKTIGKVSDDATYFNFLSSHDGIGLRPTEGILTDEEREVLVNKTVENGGKVSYKNNPDGTKSVYELNINYGDALINQKEDTKVELQVQKILAAHSILLSMIGVPAIYYHSLLGSRNYYKGVEESNINRRINREKLEYDAILNDLKEDPRRNNIFEGFMNLLDIRKQEEAFSPFGEQKVLDFGDSIFSLEREAKDSKVVFVVNLDSNETFIETKLSGKDLITGKDVKGKITLKPYEFMWIKVK